MLEAGALNDDEYLICDEPSLLWCWWPGLAALSPMVAYAGSSKFAALSAADLAPAPAAGPAATGGAGPAAAATRVESLASDDWLRVSGDGACCRRCVSARASLKRAPVETRFVSHLTTKLRTLSIRIRAETRHYSAFL